MLYEVLVLRGALAYVDAYSVYIYSQALSSLSSPESRASDEDSDANG